MGGLVEREIRPGACKHCGIYGHQAYTCRNRMEQDFNKGEISSTSSEESDASSIEDEGEGQEISEWHQQHTELEEKLLLTRHIRAREAKGWKKKESKKKKDKKKKKKKKDKKKRRSKRKRGESESESE